jgi:transporter family-2 protein
MNATLFFILLALIAGLTIPTQAGINAQLTTYWAQSPILAATISFFVGTVGLIIYVVLTKITIPPLNEMTRAPWWIWVGGLLGAFFVSSTIFLAPKLGATTMTALILAGQMSASLYLDHFGYLGYPEHAASPGRIAGVLLIAGGVAMVQIF